MKLFRRLSKTVVKRDDLACHELDGEALLYDEAAEVTVRLNDTAYFIWQHCDGIRSTNDVAALLSKDFEVDPATAQRDVSQAVRQMVKDGIANRVRRGATS